MKDAQGHGSDTRGGAGAHSDKIQATPQLQRRHFEAIAADLKSAPDAGSPAHAARVSDMADKLSTTNPGFRRSFFVAAATPGGAYRNKGPGKNAADVQRTAKAFSSRVMATHDGPREKSGLGSGMWAKKAGGYKPDPAAGFERFK